MLSPHAGRDWAVPPQWIVAERPQIVQLEPAEGTEEGGDTVLVKGHNFQDFRNDKLLQSRTWVRWGSVLIRPSDKVKGLEPLRFLDATTLVLRTPPMPPTLAGTGMVPTVNVNVTFDGHAGYARRAMKFTYKRAWRLRRRRRSRAARAHPARAATSVMPKPVSMSEAHSLVYHWGNGPSGELATSLLAPPSLTTLSPIRQQSR